MEKNPDFDHLLSAILNKELIKGVLSSPCGKDMQGVTKVSIRGVEIKGEHRYQVTEQIGNQAVHRNLTSKECREYVEKLFPKSFKQGNFSTVENEYHLLSSKKGHFTVIKKSKTGPMTLQLQKHNRTKSYLLEEGEPIPFLVALGIMSKSGKVLPQKYDKFKQINRFVEMVDDVADSLPKAAEKKLKVVDFGCGKAYLTFALYHYLHFIKGYELEMIGLDLKSEVIEQCRSLALALNYSGLEFIVGDAKDCPLKSKVDLVISLHACNTATDIALEKGVEWEAEVILSVPCCQHELYDQVKSDDLESLLRHGILRERFASLVTDAVRADLLEAMGYQVQVIEFIDSEHTPKNLMIRAVRAKKPSKRGYERYLRLEKALHIHPYLKNCFLKYLESDRTEK